MENPVVVYNWKTYVVSVADAVTTSGSLEGSRSVRVVVCPSSLHVSAVGSEVRDGGIMLGAQDIATLEDDPQTGCLSGAQLRSAGVLYTLVGHAETRANGVTNAMVATKAVHASSSGLVPIVCVGGHSGDEQVSDEGVAAQLTEIINAISAMKHEGTFPIVAYEPIAYIGADTALVPSEIKRVVEMLRNALRAKRFGDAPVIYGGSVTPENAKEICEHGGVDGFLLGRSSVDAERANAILHTVASCAS